MTEQEALTKWCPFSRVAFKTESISFVANRGIPSSDEVYGSCIGPKCMAWRFSIIEKNDSGLPVETWPDLIRFHPAGTKLIRHGYCGLAGELK